MNRGIAFFAASVFATLTLSADIIRIVPPSPNEFDAIKVDVGGLWRDSCVPFRPQVSVTGNRIDIRFTTFYGQGIGCLTSSTPWAERVNVGVLPPGIYEIIATVDAVGPSSELGRGPLIVRGAAPFVLAPVGGSVAGGEPVTLAPRQFIDSSTVTSVRFGGLAAPIKFAGITSLVVETPPHSAGAVDVDIVTSDGATRRQPAAFIYYDPSGDPDPFVHAPVLFPLSYSGPGAFGSSWAADNLIPPGRYKNAPPVDGDLIGSTGLFRLRTEPVGTGYLLYAVRGDQTPTVGRTCGCTSHARVTSTDDGEGTEVPVVLEGDFVTTTMRLLNVPALRGARATLRLYALRGTTCEAAVPGGGLHTVALARFADDRPFFGAIDMSEDLQRLDAQASVNLFASCHDVTAPFWGMLTITDNATQHMTIISPE